MEVLEDFRLDQLKGSTGWRRQIAEKAEEGGARDPHQLGVVEPTPRAEADLRVDARREQCERGAGLCEAPQVAAGIDNHYGPRNR